MTASTGRKRKRKEGRLEIRISDSLLAELKDLSKKRECPMTSLLTNCLEELVRGNKEDGHREGD